MYPLRVSDLISFFERMRTTMPTGRCSAKRTTPAIPNAGSSMATILMKCC